MMAGKKKSYMEFEFEEDFNKWFNRVRKIGYEDGFKQGLITALSYIMAPAIEIFGNWQGDKEDAEENYPLKFGVHNTEDLVSDAMYRFRQRELADWKKREAWKEAEIKQKVEEELKKRSSENPQN